MQYVLFFRGLNVGGKHRVKMTELAALLTELGFAHVQTYIQSGNAVLDAQLPEGELCRKVAQAFLLRFGFASTVVARSAEALRTVAEAMPFSGTDIAAAKAAEPDTEHLYLYFLPEPPTAQALALLAASDVGGDRVVVGERVVYLLCAGSVRTSPGAVRLAKLFPDATARNGKTLDAMLALLRP